MINQEITNNGSLFQKKIIIMIDNLLPKLKGEKNKSVNMEIEYLTKYITMYFEIYGYDEYSHDFFSGNTHEYVKKFENACGINIVITKNCSIFQKKIIIMIEDFLYKRNIALWRGKHELIKTELESLKKYILLYVNMWKADFYHNEIYQHVKKLEMICEINIVNKI